MPAVTGFLAACVAGLCMLVLSPLFGRLADRLPTRKPLLYAGAAVGWLVFTRALPCSLPAMAFGRPWH